MAVHHIPEGFHTINASVTVPDTAAAIAFYERVFGAVEAREMRMQSPGGGPIVHAEITIGDSALMLNDAFPEWGNVPPVPGVPTPVRLHLYVPDLEATVERASAAGATIVRPVSVEFYGHKAATIVDPSGVQWALGQKVEDLTIDQMRERMDGFMNEMAEA